MGKKSATRTRFTVSVVKSVAAGGTVYDERVPNLGVRVSQKERRTFFVLGKGGERATIGPFPQITIEAARRTALDINEQFAKGTSPRKQKAQQKRAEASELRWLAVWEDYRANRKNKRANSDSRTLDHQWQKYLAHWSDRTLSEMPFDEVRAYILKVRKKAPITANRVHRQGKAMFNHAITELQWKGENPFEFSQLSEKGRERDRVVSREELHRLFAACDALQSDVSGDLFKMCVYTGQRVGNVRKMRFSQINFDEGVWRIPDTKQGKPHKAVLPTLALELLEQRRGEDDLVYPGRIPERAISKGGYKNAWQRVLEVAEIEDLTVHDLRSVHATQNLEAGIVEQIQQQLGHASPEMTQRYLRPGAGSQRLLMDAALAGISGVGDA